MSIDLPQTVAPSPAGARHSVGHCGTCNKSRGLFRRPSEGRVPGLHARMPSTHAFQGLFRVDPFTLDAAAGSGRPGRPNGCQQLSTSGL